MMFRWSSKLRERKVTINRSVADGSQWSETGPPIHRSESSIPFQNLPVSLD